MQGRASSTLAFDGGDPGRLLDEAVEEGQTAARLFEDGVSREEFLADGLYVFWTQAEVMNSKGDGLITHTQFHVSFVFHTEKERIVG